MGATLIGTTSSGPFFGMTNTEENFISATIEAGVVQEQNEIETFNGGCVKTFANKVFNASISGFSTTTTTTASSSLFNDIFFTERFKDEDGYFLAMDEIFLNTWEMIFSKVIIPIKRTDVEPEIRISWFYDSTADDVKNEFIQIGFPLAQVVKRGSGIWSVSGVSGVFQSTIIPRTNYPILVSVSYEGGNIIFTSEKLGVRLLINSVSQKENADSFMSFNIDGSWYEEPIVGTEVAEFRLGTRPSPIDYF